MLRATPVVLQPATTAVAALRAASTQAIAPSADKPSGAVADVRPPPPANTGLLASIKKGPGGRSSFSGNVITVFGGTGLHGQYVINRLAKHGAQLVVPYRCDPYDVRHLKILGDLGQILYFPFELTDEDSIRKAVKYSNVVINMIGKDFETTNYPFEKVHVEGAQRLARISRQMGVERFIHFSALNASHKPQEYYVKGGSRFLKSKAAGEDAVRSEFSNAVVVRPAAIYSWWDRFHMSYLHFQRDFRTIGSSVYKRGKDTYKMPVYMADVSNGIQKIVEDPTWDGQTIEFVGPYSYQLYDLVYFMRWLTGRWPNELIYDSRFDALNYLQTSWNTWLGRRMKWHPRFNWEQREVFEFNSDRLTGVPLLCDVIGAQNMHIYEWASRIMLWEQDISGGEHAQSFIQQDISGGEHMVKMHAAEPPPIVHYPPLLAPGVQRRRDHIQQPLVTTTTQFKHYTPHIL